MSLISSIGKIAKTVFSSKFLKTTDKAKNLSLINTATVLDKPTAGFSLGKTVVSAAGKVIKSGANLVADAFKTAKPTTKLAVIAATPVAAGTLIESKKARKAVINTPSSLYNFGSNLGKVVENPSFSTAKDVFTENPLLAGGTAAAGGLLLGKGIFSAATSIASTQALQKNTEAISEKSFGSGIIETLQQSGSNKYDIKLVEEQTKQLKLQLESQEKIAKIQAEAASKLPSTTPAAATAESPLTTSQPVAAAPIKKKAKKKKKKAKPKKKKTTKKKTKKKAKTIKRKKPTKKKKAKKKSKKTKKRRKK